MVWSLYWYNEACTKWQPLCRRHFHTHFIELKLMYISSNFTWSCSYRSNWGEVIIGSGNDLVPNRQQAITWTNDDCDAWCHIASLAPQWIAHTIFLISKSCRNFAWSTAAWLPCSVQNFSRIHCLKWMSWIAWWWFESKMDFQWIGDIITAPWCCGNPNWIQLAPVDEGFLSSSAQKWRRR